MDRIGRYKIVRELGRGAMGVVYHAIDPNIGRPVAIKTINLGAGRKPDEQERMRERLFREARSAGILSHPGIVTIYDVEQQGDVAYIAMEYVDGPTLDQMLSEPQPLSPERMFSILGQTSAALDYAHGKGIVHRDIKPANIMVAADGTAKITDFGIAKINTSEQLTMTGSIVGTPHYMSPEQVQGQQIDGRSDQFSLAVIAYEMLTGEKPYTGEHLTTVVYKIVAEEAPPPHRINATLSLSIESVLRKGLSKKPEGRFATCQEFAEALEKACATSKGWQSMPRGGILNTPTVADKAVPSVALPPSRRARGAELTTSTAERRPQQKSSFLPFLLAVLMAGALLAIVGWEAKPWLNFTRPSGPPATQAQEQQQSNPRPATPPQAPAETKPSPMPPTVAANQPPAATEPPTTTTPAPTTTPPATDQKSTAEEAVVTPPPKKVAAVTPPVRRVPVARPITTPQPVTVISSPGGAIATLDGQADTACTTPCTMDAAPGRHTIEIRKTGYSLENREVDVTNSPLELPAVVLRQMLGTLMLSSDPVGAAVLVNGKRYSQLTPAQIQLSPGNYTITVEWKDGKQSSRTIQIRDGINYQKFIVGQ